MARTQRFKFEQRLRWWQHQGIVLSDGFPIRQAQNEMPVGHTFYWLGGSKKPIFAKTLSMWGGFTMEPPQFR